MAVTYDWRVEQMESYPLHEGQKNVVFNIHWRANAADGIFMATAYGTAGVQYDGAAPFTAYESLTQEEVVGWVKDSLGEDQVAQIEAGLAGEIDAKKNPKSIVNPLPWAAE